MTTDIKIIRDWMARYQFFTCEPTRELAATVTTAEEFYEGLDIVNHFFTGIANNNPPEALRIIMGCISAVLPPPDNKMLADARAVAINPEATMAEIKAKSRVLTIALRTRNVPKALTEYYNLIYQLLCWRSGRMVKMISVVISSKIIEVRRKTFGDKLAQQVVVAEMKKLIPFEQWLAGINEEAYRATPYQ